MNTIDCFKLLYAVLPLLLGLILIMRTGDVNKSMLYGNFLGLVLYNVRVCIKALVSTEGSYSGLFLAQMVFESSYKTISECIRLFRGIILDKASIATAVFVLFVMVKLICGSNALQYIDQAAVRFVTSKVRFLTVFLVLSLLFSIDDYLCCVGVAAVTATITARHGISKEKAAYMICLLAVALCTLMPCSSWNPVIRSAIGSFVPVGGVLLMNLSAYYFVFVVSAEVLSEASSTIHKRDVAKLPDDSGKVFGVLIACAVLASMAMCIVNFMTDGTWSVTAAGIAGCFILLTAGARCGMLKLETLGSEIHEAFMDTFSLFRTLLLVWMVKDICIELLGLSNCLTTVMEAVSFPPFLIPGVVYLVSSGFAFVTGTAFGAFSLFIPMAISLVGNSGNYLKTVAAAAALAGSLQSVNRPGSDVINLTSGVLKCDKTKVMNMQKNGVLLATPVLFISFSLSGACACFGRTAMFCAGIAPLILCSIILYINRRNDPQTETVISMYITAVPFYRTFHTFYQKCMDLEVLYSIVLLRFGQKAVSF